MHESILVTVIQYTLSPIAVLVVGAMLNRKVKKKVADVQADQRETAEVTKAVHEQVANDHESNLREDIDAVGDRVMAIEGRQVVADQKQDETLELVRSVVRTQAVGSEQIRTLFKQVERLVDRLDHHIDRPRE